MLTVDEIRKEMKATGLLPAPRKLLRKEKGGEIAMATEWTDMRLKKPARIGVQFMGDLFHEDVPDEFIMRVFDSIEMRKKFQETLARKREEKESSPTDKLAQKERKRAADRDYHRKKRAEKKPKSGNSKSETRLVLAKTFPCPNCGAQLMIHE
jgi:hypothetical protein